MKSCLVTVALMGLVGCGRTSQSFDAMDPSDEEPGRGALALRWRFPMRGDAVRAKPQEFATPALSERFVRESRLYIGSHEGTFYAMTGMRGEVLWKQRLSAVSSEALVQNGVIFVGTDDGILYCLEGVDGATRWKYETRGAILQAPVVVGDLVIFSNEADIVFALDRHSGAFRWQHKVETPDAFTMRGHSGVAAADGLVFAGFADGRLVALRAASGTVAWVKSLTGPAERFVDVDSTPLVIGDTVYATSSSGGLFGLDKETGAQKWRLPMDGAGPLISDGKRLYVGAAETGIHAVDFAGHIIWRQGIRGGGEPADLAVNERYLIYALSEGGLFVANKDNGVVYQYFDPGLGISGAPVLDKDQIYVLSNGGILYALDLMDV